MIRIWSSPATRDRGYAVAPIVVALLVGLPLVFVLAALVRPPGESWQHLRSTLLGGYIIDTAVLAFGVTVCASLIGTGLAWFTTNFEFPGVRVFAWAVALPIALPAYISAYTYSHITGVTGPMFTFARWLFGRDIALGILFDMMSLPGCIFVMTFALYPYVYLSARAFFAGSSRHLIESARAYGHSDTRVFFSVALPIARPAILGGASLVLMETLNEYGATSYFGVQSMVTGIYRSWFSLGDIDSALRLAAVFLLAAVVVLTAERMLRGRRRFHHGTMAPQSLNKPSRRSALFMCLSCAAATSLGLLIPFAQLLAFSARSASFASIADLAGITFRSVVLSGAGGALCVLVSLALVLSIRRSRGALVRVTHEIVAAGYAIPGAIVVVGILSGSRVASRFSSLLLIGSIALLLYAYLIRYLAVVMRPLQSGLDKIPESFDDAGALSGRSWVSVFFGVHAPILRSAIGAGFFIVCIDLLKELPMTLVLRPFNFATLATRAFEFAQQDRLAEAALPSIVIVLVGLLPAISLARKANPGEKDLVNKRSELIRAA